MNHQDVVPDEFKGLEKLVSGFSFISESTLEWTADTR